MTRTAEQKCKARYGLRFETADGTLENPYHFMSRKAEAVRAARLAAKSIVSPDVVRVWVDDMCAELGVASFKTPFAA